MAALIYDKRGVGKSTGCGLAQKFVVAIEPQVAKFPHNPFGLLHLIGIGFCMKVGFHADNLCRQLLAVALGAQISVGLGQRQGF